ncbi:MAG: DUF4255 domain-containing protein [Dehalococcoidia bacterium]
MFNDVDETIRKVLVADVPVERNEVDISFDRPTREWSSRLSRPTLNLFLLDVRELMQFRNEVEHIERTSDGRVRKSRPNRRVDMTYLITAWAREPEDEHRILSRVLASMFRQYRVAAEHLHGQLVEAVEPLLLRIAPPDFLVKPADFWGVMDNEMRPNLTWVATAPLDAFAPIDGPLVRTADLRFREREANWWEEVAHIGGVVYRGGDRTAGVSGVQIAIDGTTFRETTADDGRFVFRGAPQGTRLWRIIPPEGAERRREVTIPSDSYDITLE